MTEAKTILQQLRQELDLIYEPQESDAIARWLLEDFFGLRTVDIATGKSPDLQGFDKWKEALPLLRSQMPVQYVLGYAWFGGRQFAVGEGVLIPRQETEQLVQIAADFLNSLPEKNPVIADLCTGSGCIAHTLALRHPGATVYAFDNSPQALYYTHLNAKKLSVQTLIREADVLSEDFAENLPPCDLIVSNPPYVRQSERVQMQPRVLYFEPPYALFVADSDPLVFYRAIARTAALRLKAGGQTIVEINEALGEPTAAVFSAAGFAYVQVVQDLHGKDRFVLARS
ncbi:peptide chain release factor N(5)-glutamine methyltransferase [Rhodoflexus sp.]